MTRDELTKLAEKYRAKADHAYNVYQETGIARYDRERRNAEDMADAFGAAANAVDDYALLCQLRAVFVFFASQADTALAENAPREKLAGILEHIITYAAVTCHYAWRERPSENQKKTEE